MCLAVWEVWLADGVVMCVVQDAADLHWLGSSDTGSQRLGVALGRGLTVYDIAYEGDAGAPKLSTIGMRCVGAAWGATSD